MSEKIIVEALADYTPEQIQAAKENVAGRGLDPEWMQELFEKIHVGSIGLGFWTQLKCWQWGTSYDGAATHRLHPDAYPPEPEWEEYISFTGDKVKAAKCRPCDGPEGYWMFHEAGAERMISDDEFNANYRKAGEDNHGWGPYPNGLGALEKLQVQAEEPQPLKQESKRRLAFYKIDEYSGEEVLYITQHGISSITTDGSDERFVGYCFDDTGYVWPCRMLYVLDFNGTQMETNINTNASKIFDTKWATHVAIWEDQL